MMRIMIIFEEVDPKGPPGKAPPEQENNQKYPNHGQNIQILHGRCVYIFSFTSCILRCIAEPALVTVLVGVSRAQPLSSIKGRLTCPCYTHLSNETRHKIRPTYRVEQQKCQPKYIIFCFLASLPIIEAFIQQ